MTPGDAHERITIADGTVLRIRPLQHGEDWTIRELWARLSDRTRMLRFFSPMPLLSDPLLRLLADVDGRRRFALIAQSGRDDGGDVVALANIGGREDGYAEVAVVVADAWQRQGLGAMLAARLLQTAESRGFRRFIAHVRSDNVAARRLLGRVAAIVSADTRIGESEISFTRA